MLRHADSNEETRLLPKNETVEIVMGLEDLRDRFQALEAKASKPLGNPAVVGLAGFGLTTIILQFHNLDLITLTPIIWLGLFFGGLAQMVAGIQEFWTGNNFGYSAFTTYGCFWIALVTMLLGNKLKVFEMSSKDLGLFLVCFTAYTLLMFGASLRTNTALAMTFFLLFLGFLLLDISELVPNVKVGFKYAAAGVLICCALAAWYVMAHLIYKDAYGRDVLPVGPAPIVFVSQKLKSRRRYVAAPAATV